MQGLVNQARRSVQPCDDSGGGTAANLLDMNAGMGGNIEYAELGGGLQNERFS